MRLPVSQNLPLAALILLLSAGATASAKDRAALPPANGPQSDYPMVLGQPFTVDGVTYTPADTLNYDVVGLAATGIDGGDGISASHRTLPLPSYVEITALDTGRTILVRLERRGPMTGGLLTQLSPAAAAQLGIRGQDRAAVRVRRVNPPEPERAALRSGRAAPARMDMPAPLRTVLLRRLAQQGAGAQVSREGPMPTPDKLPAVAVNRATDPVAPTQVPAEPKPAPVLVAARDQGNWLVQVGAFSLRPRAEAVARSVGGRTFPVGKVWRVRITGFTTQASAGAALAKVHAAGYTDARVQRAD